VLKPGGLAERPLLWAGWVGFQVHLWCAAATCWGRGMDEPAAGHPWWLPRWSARLPARRRYVVSWPEAQTRRNLALEQWLRQHLGALSRRLRGGAPPQEQRVMQVGARWCGRMLADRGDGGGGGGGLACESALVSMFWGQLPQREH
jgi:hypothetical protein